MDEGDRMAVPGGGGAADGIGSRSARVGLAHRDKGSPKGGAPSSGRSPASSARRDRTSSLKRSRLARRSRITTLSLRMRLCLLPARSFQRSRLRQAKRNWRDKGMVGEVEGMEAPHSGQDETRHESGVAHMLAGSTQLDILVSSFL